ncbi:LpxI family protein [Flaviflagellibacter deserti]|uniref:LpxI family protein n=2 Tax=Flaviflagellibacter deserti TaxID=2267266 RepID=A0ABV9Z2K8_9HYPH
MPPETGSAPVPAGTPLAIVCGSGAFPLAVAEIAARQRPVFLIGLQGAADSAIAHYPHGWIRMGQLGRLIDLARSADCKDILFVGGVTRPSGLSDGWPDLALLRQIPRLLRGFRGGDDRLLKVVADVMTDAGLRVVGVAEVAPDLMARTGVLAGKTPGAATLDDVCLGLDVLDAISPYDVGQSTAVADGRVLAIEAAEGTDLMIARIAELRASGKLRLGKRRGVLVKGAKRGQDLRLDTPALGPKTIDGVAAAGLSGIAVVAGEVMIIEVDAVTKAAERHGLFIFGMERRKP